MEFNFAELHESTVKAIPDREAIVWRDRRLSFAEVGSRTRQLARYLRQCGLGITTEREFLAGHESGQDHLALYLYNGNEYIEGLLGAFKARVAPVNVNYRYVEEELLYLFENSACRGIIYHSAFAPQVEAVRKRFPQLEVLIQVADDSGNGLLEGAVEYEAALASVSDEVLRLAYSPDDLYMLYTGGTTGMPKGVLWRSADIFVAAMKGEKLDGAEYESYEEIFDAVSNSSPSSFLLAPPLMHGAAQWASISSMVMGVTLVLPDNNEKLDPHDYLLTAERERCFLLSIVGDAFAVPILDQLSKQNYDLDSVLVVGSGGAPLSTVNKNAFLEKLPNIIIMDSIGSSESGVQASNMSTKQAPVTTGDFKPSKGARILGDQLDCVLSPSLREAADEEVGWFAQRGRAPLGYLGDAEKTARTFPVVDGVRYSVPGDRARFLPDGSIEVLGRDSVTINSGGEKIFAEEVEAALKQHGDVYDTVVAGRPSQRWGEEVVAIVRLREGASATDADLLAEAGKHIAAYKLPKQILYRAEIQRSPSGKADYRWAKEQAQGSG